MSRLESLARHVKDKHKEDGVTAEQMAREAIKRKDRNRKSYKGQRRQAEDRFRKYQLVSGEEITVPEDPLPLNKLCITLENN